MTNKQILRDYVDACELIKETESDIKKLQGKKKAKTKTVVSGSNPEFPYNPQHFTVEGTEYTYQDDQSFRMREKMLKERKAYAEQIKAQAEYAINQAPVRMQRIIRFRYEKNLPWEEIAVRMGRGATKDSLRMELDRFLREK